MQFTRHAEGGRTVKLKSRIRAAGLRVTTPGGYKVTMSNHNQTLRIRTRINAGRMSRNHNQTLRVRTGLKAGRRTDGISMNHNQTLRVRTGLQAGRRFDALTVNHNQTLRVRTGIKAGLIFPGWDPAKDAQQDAERSSTLGAIGGK
jgi:hypothetical protein